MKRLLYISNARIPTPMAHGLQIMQNCEAFADTAQVNVTLWCAQRPPLPGADVNREADADPWKYYGVKRNFELRRLPCLDLIRYFDGRSEALTTLARYLQLGTLVLSVIFAALFTQADVYYSRDPLTLFALGFFKPRRSLVYEAHRLNRPGRGAWLQKNVLRRVAHTVAVTPPLAEGLEKLQANLPPEQRSKIMVAHDGIREARFAALSTKAEARRILGWPQEAFIVGYVGRLKTMGMDKGVDTLIAALAKLGGKANLALVGGPDDIAAQYQAQWYEAGLPAEKFLYAGQVASERVPTYLSAFDLCAMPLPWTEHFAYYASPIKLFEYMASGRALVASELPSYADVIQDGENALLVPPSDAEALAAAITRLQGDPILRTKLAENAQTRVHDHYTWAARARAILRHIEA